MRTSIKVLAAAAIVMVCSCNDALKERVDSLEARVAALEAKVQANVDAIEKLVAAGNSAVTINSVRSTDDGYVINFSDGTVATISNGVDGADGSTPVIGVTEIGGVLCWTVNGTPLKNGSDYVPVAGNDGSDGRDGVTPEFKVEDGKWFVSYDNGGTWDEVGAAVTEVGPAITVSETDTEYIFTIGDDMEIRIPKTKAGLALKLVTDKVRIEAGKTTEFGYVLTGADETTHVVAEAQYYTASVDEAGCTVRVTAPESLSKGYVIVKAVRNSDGASFSQYVVFDVNEDAYGIFGSIIWIGNDDEYINW